MRALSDKQGMRGRGSLVRLYILLVARFIERMYAPTSEHVFALLIVNDRSRLQILRFEEVGYRDSLWLWWPRLDWLLLLLLLLLLSSLLRLHLHLRLVLLHCLCLEPLDIFLYRNSVLLCLSCELALHHLNLLGCGLLSGLGHSRRWSLKLSLGRALGRSLRWWSFSLRHCESYMLLSVREKGRRLYVQLWHGPNECRSWGHRLVGCCLLPLEPHFIESCRGQIGRRHAAPM